MLEEYAECKAEGADCVLRAEIIDLTNAEPVEQVGASYKSYAVFRFVSETGGGIHGVPWFDDVFSTMPYGDSGVCLIVETIEGLDELAAKIMQRVRDASRSDYWMMPGYNASLRHFTWAVDRNGERYIEKDFLTAEEIAAVHRGYEHNTYGEITGTEVAHVLANHDWLNPVKK